jgi:ribonuclease BN (tRNA processing enzyme)
MRVIVLGSGTAVPHPRRAASAHWLETNNGSLLLDASSAVVHRMAQENLDWAGLDAIWISHFHLDHIGGLAPFLFGTKHAPQTQSRRKPLMIFGPQGLKKLVHAFDEANNYRLFKQPFTVEIREVLPHAEFEILHGLKAQTFPTPHTSESLAIRLTEESGASMAYTSDTGYAESLADFSRRVELLMMECSFRQDKPRDTHLELADAMLLAARAEPRRVLLTHLYPEWDGVDITAEAKKLWPGETEGASDGLRLEVTKQQPGDVSQVSD